MPSSPEGDARALQVTRKYFAPANVKIVLKIFHEQDRTYAGLYIG